jgi:hypothetical protein
VNVGQVVWRWVWRRIVGNQYLAWSSLPKN